MTIKEEKSALQEISNLLPPGYLKTIPFSINNDVSFEFNGVLLKMSALYLNKAANCYMFDLSWSSTNKINGIPIRCGINILEQYTTPLPNLYANNHAYPGMEIITWRDLNLVLIDETVLERG